MNGSFVVIFSFEKQVGQLELNLNSLSKSEGTRSGHETFNGWGNERVNNFEFYFSVRNGEVKSNGWWQMDVIFASGKQFTYWGTQKKGWFMEGCFTEINSPFKESSCWGRGWLFPKQLSTSQGTQVLLGIGGDYFPEDVEMENKDKYLRKRANLMKLLSHAGNDQNPKNKDRTAKFNGGPSHLFFNDFFSIEKFFSNALNFVSERFGRDKQAQNYRVRLKRKIWHLCQFDAVVQCPKQLKKSTMNQLKRQMIN